MTYFSPEVRKKLSEIRLRKKALLGYINSPETRLKMSIAHKKSLRCKEAIKKLWSSQKGYKHSEETKKKISIAHLKLGRKLEKHPSWKGGVSFKPYTLAWTKKLKLSIRKRDHFFCQLCGITEKEHLKKLGRVLSVNHIDFNKENCDPSNLNTLCISCNSFVNFDREKWTKIFRNKIKNLHTSLI